MRRLSRPEINDEELFKSIASNKRLASHPSLSAAIDAVAAGYEQYREVNGDVRLVQHIHLSDEQKGHLETHFKKPPSALKYIGELRGSTGHQSCPMCGSLHSGTLDHVVPRSSHAEFSIFSSNLVPACLCNSKRGAAIVGPSPGQRILHPYFDDCLNERLIAAHFEDLGLVPRISVLLTHDALVHPQVAAIEFHVLQVVRRTTIIRYLRERWAQLCRQPAIVLRFASRPVESVLTLEALLHEERELLDAEHQHGKNNWKSAFVSGLLDPLVVAWLFKQLPDNEGSLHCAGGFDVLPGKLGSLERGVRSLPEAP